MAWTRITARWTGWQGAPGYSRMRFIGDLDATSAAAASANWLNFLGAIGGSNIPSGIVIATTGVAEIYGSDGKISGVVSYTPGTKSAAGTGAYAGGSGACVTWHTGMYRNGRETRGRTFLVPLVSAFEANGTLSTAVITGLQTAAATFIGSTPKPAIVHGEGGKTPTDVGFDTITSAVVPDLAAILKSRRT